MIFQKTLFVCFETRDTLKEQILSLACSAEFLGVSGWTKFTGLKSNTLDSHIQPGGQGSFNLSMKTSV